MEAKDILKEKARIRASIIDELCYCGALQSEHNGLQGHGSCEKTNCNQFTWKEFIFKTKEGKPSKLKKTRADIEKSIEAVEKVYGIKSKKFRNKITGEITTQIDLLDIANYEEVK